MDCRTKKSPPSRDDKGNILKNLRIADEVNVHFKYVLNVTYVKEHEWRTFYNVNDVHKRSYDVSKWKIL